MSFWESDILVVDCFGYVVAVNYIVGDYWNGVGGRIDQELGEGDQVRYCKAELFQSMRTWKPDLLVPRGSLRAFRMEWHEMCTTVTYLTLRNGGQEIWRSVSITHRRIL